MSWSRNCFLVSKACLKSNVPISQTHRSHKNIRKTSSLGGPSDISQQGPCIWEQCITQCIYQYIYTYIFVYTCVCVASKGEKAAVRKSPKYWWLLNGTAMPSCLTGMYSFNSLSIGRSDAEGHDMMAAAQGIASRYFVPCRRGKVWLCFFW